MEQLSNGLMNLTKEFELMKAMLMCQQNCHDSEGELSDWAKKELAEARKAPNEELISMAEIEKEFL